MIIKDTLKTVLFAVGFAPRRAIRGIVSQKEADSLAYLQKIITDIARMALFAFAANKLARLVESGLITQGDINAICDALFAVLVTVVVAVWSNVIRPWWNNRVWPWIQKQIGPVPQ